ncbi:MAG: patatin-like phospholipase family protein [Planctomycetes bacterium]|nr:patatin-like phospholipase family protein [Planctomycetota bacterium]
MTSSPVDMERVILWLKGVRLCAGLDDEQLRSLASQVEVRPFQAGETLSLAGDEVTEFWVVAEGELDAFVTDARGRETLLGTVLQGETVGEIAILEHSTTRPARFTARTHGTLLVAPAALLHDWVKTYPRLMQNLFLTLSERFKAVTGVASRNLRSPRLGIVVTSPRGYRLAGRLVARLVAAGERLRVMACDVAAVKASGGWPESFPVEALAESDTPLLQPPAAEIDRQIVLWTPGASRAADLRQLQGSDEILWFFEAADATTSSHDFHAGASQSAGLLDRVRVVWLLDAATPVAPLWTKLELKTPDIKVRVETSGGELNRLERQGLDRLVRALRGYSIGIALAGGGAKGMAHFGVLQALEEAGISCDMMSGTSAGAMAGILYASGMPPADAIANFERDLKASRFFHLLPKWPNWYLVSQYRRRTWDAKLRKYLHDWQLEQLPIPFNAVTVDLVQVQTVVRQRGDAVHSILESINLPIVSKPILRDGMALVDGGVLNNLPADVLAEHGADFVIGVDVSSRVRTEFAGNRPNMPTSKMRDASALDTLFRIFESQAHNLGKMRNRAVDFWIKPDTSGFGLAEFHRTAEIAAVGQAAAREIVAELKQRLVDLEQRLLTQPRRRS